MSLQDKKIKYLVKIKGKLVDNPVHTVHLNLVIKYTFYSETCIF